MKKKILCIFLSIVMLFGMIPFTTFTSFALGRVEDAVRDGLVLFVGDLVNIKITSSDMQEVTLCFTKSSSTAQKTWSNDYLSAELSSTTVKSRGTVTLTLKGLSFAEEAQTVSIYNGKSTSWAEVKNIYVLPVAPSKIGDSDTTWLLEKIEGTTKYRLIIDGTGEIPDMSCNSYPWHDFNDKISELVIGKDVTNIPNFANGNTTALTALTSVTVNSKNIVFDKNYAFCFVNNDSPTLKTVTFGEGVETVSFPAGNVFSNNKVFKTLNLPSTLKSFTYHSATFTDNTGFTTINLAEGNEYFSVKDNVLYNKEETELILVPTASASIKPVSTVQKIKAGQNVDVAAMFSEQALNDNIQITLRHYKDGKTPDSNVFYVGEMIKADVTAKEGELPDGLFYVWLGMTSSYTAINNTNTMQVAGFENPDMLLDGKEFLMSPDALYGAVKITYFNKSPYTGTAYCRFAVCRTVNGVTNIVAYKDFTAKADTSTYSYNYAMKYIANGNTVTMFKGETRSVQELLGRCGITHITCAAVTVSNVANKNDSSAISVSDNSITAVDMGTNISVGFKIATNNCLYHYTGTADDNTLSINVIEAPKIETKCTSVTINNPAQGYDYFIGQQKGEVKDGKVYFTGLKPETEYNIRMQIMGANSEATYTCAVKSKTLPHDFSGYIINNDGTHTTKCVNGCELTGATTDHVFTDHVCVCGETDLPKHEHTLTFTAEGNVISAECSDETCALYTTPAKLTLSAEGGAYNNSAYTAQTDDETVGFTSETKSALGDIIYYLSDGETLTYAGTENAGKAPVNAGTYVAKATLTYDTDKTVTAVKSFTITKADPTVATAPTASVKYGDTPADADISGAMNATGAFAWKDVTSYGDAGETTLTAVFTPTDTANYNSVDVDVAVTVAKTDYDGDKGNETTLNGLAESTASVVLPEPPAGASYGTPAVSGVSGVTATKETVSEKLTLKLTVNTEIPTETAPFTVTIPVTGATNYNDYDYVITVTPVRHTHTKGTEHEENVATCTEKGNVLYYDCTGCDKKLDADGNEIADIEIAALGHSFNGDYVQGTGENANKHARKCERYGTCGAVGNMNDTTAVEGYTDCTYNQTTANSDYLKSAADCMSAAVYFKYCVCGGCDTEKAETFTSGDKNAENHVTTGRTPVAAQAATCQQAGWDAYEICSCGAVLGYNGYAQKDHSYTGEYKDNEDGSTHSQKCVNGCENYGNPTAHTGMDDFTCDDCGYVDEEQKEQAKGNITVINEEKPSILVNKDEFDELILDNFGKISSSELVISEVKDAQEFNAIKKLAGDFCTVEGFDATLTVDGVEETELNGKLAITVGGFSAEGKSDINVLRTHNGEASKLSSVKTDEGEYYEIVEGKIVLHVNQLCTFAVSYVTELNKLQKQTFEEILEELPDNLTEKKREEIIEQAKEEIKAAESAEELVKVKESTAEKTADIKTSFRCPLCPRYEEEKDIPFYGFILSIVHMFVHLAYSINRLT